MNKIDFQALICPWSSPILSFKYEVLISSVGESSEQLVTDTHSRLSDCLEAASQDHRQNTLNWSESGQKHGFFKTPFSRDLGMASCCLRESEKVFVCVYACIVHSLESPPITNRSTKYSMYILAVRNLIKNFQLL